MPAKRLLSSLALVLLAGGLICLFLLASAPSGPPRRGVVRKRSRARKAPASAARHFVYVCPPKTGSLVTRGELRRFCREQGLKCLGQNDPCPSMGSCPLKSKSPVVRSQLSTVFWAGFTHARLKVCCPKALKTQFDAAIFHPYLADPPTRKFFHSQTPADALWVTMLRDPVDQFLSFFAWVTKKHRHLYEQYMPLLQKNKDLRVEPIVSLFHRAVVEGRVEALPPDELHLFRTLTNIQSRILGWDGSPKGLRATTKSLESFAFVGLSEEIAETWVGLRATLRWPGEYLNTSLLRDPTRRKVPEVLARQIREIQFADTALYAKAKALVKRRRAKGT